MKKFTRTIVMELVLDEDTLNTIKDEYLDNVGEPIESDEDLLGYLNELCNDEIIEMGGDYYVDEVLD